MKRPSLQFYPADWRNNTKLQRATFAERGIWLEILCLMHDADEYGILRWTLKEIARVVGCSLQALLNLAQKGIIKGGDDACEAFIYRPRHAGKDGPPVEIIAAQRGPIWFSSRMVIDEYLRINRGGSTRFTSNNNPNGTSTPTARDGDEPTARQGSAPSRTPSQRHGHGASTTTSTTSSTTGVISKVSAYADASTRPDTGVRALLEKNQVNCDDTWLRIWEPHGLERIEKGIAIAKGRLNGQELRATYLDKVLNDDKNFNGTTVNGSEKPWYIHSSTAIEAKGAELGITPKDGEPFPYYRSRVMQAAGITEEMVTKAEAEYRAR